MKSAQYNIPISRIPTGAKRVFNGVIFDIYQWQQELFDGSSATFEMAKRADAVSIIPIINNKIVIIEEEQPHRGKTIGFPGGHVESGESHYVAAGRELAEETGIVFEDLKLVKVDDIGGPKLDWWIYRYIATGKISEGPQNPDPGERIITKLVDFEVAKQLSKGNVYMSHIIMDTAQSIDDLLRLPRL